MAIQGVRPARDLAAALWARYRSLSDELLTGEKANVEARRPSLRGLIALYVANCLARWIDQLEREPNPTRRAELAGLLLAVSEPAGPDGPVRRCAGGLE
jgi:hypothetical protein